jgi:hypothetical protein
MANGAGWIRVARVVAALGLAGGLAFGAPHVAGAQTNCETGHAGVPQDCTPTTTTDPGIPRSRQPSDPATQSLAFTGADVLGLAAIGGAATAVGVGLVAFGRRRRQPAVVVNDHATH